MKPVNRMKKTVKKTVTAAPAAPAPKAVPVKTTTVTAKAVAPAKPAPAPAVKPATKPVAAKTAAVPTKIPTTIEAQVDIGFGNSLFVRGQGAGLSWDQGIPLTNVDSKTWRLTVPAADKLQFKLLINDSLWAQGEDVVVAPGKSVQLTPTF